MDFCLVTVRVLNSYERRKKEHKMNQSKEELIARIEAVRSRLDQSIERHEPYDQIHKNSQELDQLIELYIEAGY